MLWDITLKHPQASKVVDPHKNIPFLPTESSGSVQWEDRGPCMHGNVVEHGTYDNKDRNYKV